MQCPFITSTYLLDRLPMQCLQRALMASESESVFLSLSVSLSLCLSLFLSVSLSLCLSVSLSLFLSLSPISLLLSPLSSLPLPLASLSLVINSKIPNKVLWARCYLLTSLFTLEQLPTLPLTVQCVFEFVLHVTDKNSKL